MANNLVRFTGEKQHPSIFIYVERFGVRVLFMIFSFFGQIY